MLDDLLKEARSTMETAVEHVASEFATVRTGRANPQILHRIHAEYYGTPTPLQQLASMSVPEPRLLVVHPFDKGALNAIERAIRESDLGVNPSNDGTVIRIVFPTLTEERRKELIRLVRHMAEEGRIAIRNIRRHTKSDMEALHGEISDDEIHRSEKDLQDLTDEMVTRIDEQLSRKESELLEV
jgi:ribosome recycling factor